MKRLTILAVLLLSFAGCNDHPVDPSECPGGENVRLPTERELCVYRWPIVIETGFSCPAERGDFFGWEPHFGACSDFGPPVRIERDFLIDRYGVPGRPWPIYSTTPQPTPSASLDLLWVIDNSGSMCQEQAALRENFAAFLTNLSTSTADFQIAITTTQMNPDYALESIAEPGHIQSTPQPVPGFDPACRYGSDENGQPNIDDFSPVRRNLELAVSCMKVPDPSLLEVTDDTLRCLDSGSNCDVASYDDLFPTPADYREIPKVLRSSDYTVDGQLDTAQLEADFACASLVGTRGYGIEKGLASAVAAVAPQNVAGPNAGFLRPDARFAVMFVSDENDCSHDGSIDESTICGGDVCELYNQEDYLGGPLLPVTELKAQLLGNLSAAKQRQVGEGEVFVGSITGLAQRYSGMQMSDEICSDQGYEGLTPSCSSSLGVAFSGDRYIRFGAQFLNAFPGPDDEGHVAGLICQGDFAPALTRLGSWLGDSVVE